MSKFDEALDTYKAALKDTLKITDFDEAALTGVAKALGPSIYNADSSLVSSSDKEELDRVKKISSLANWVWKTMPNWMLPSKKWWKNSVRQTATNTGLFFITSWLKNSGNSETINKSLLRLLQKREEQPSSDSYFY